MGEHHRLRIWASRPGIGAIWVGRCSCGVDFATCQHRLEVETAHQAHLGEVTAESEPSPQQNGQD